MASSLSRLYRDLPFYARLALRGRLPAHLAERRRYIAEQTRLLRELARRYPDIPVLREIRDRRSGGVQPVSFQLAQYWYATNAITRIAPREVHDVASHRSWVMGVAAGLRVHTVDVREPSLSPDAEVFHQGQAEQLPFADGSVECLTTLNSIQNFGLASYGDPFDPEADRKSLREMVRVLRPGGHLVFTTLCTGRDRTFIVFNARRVYAIGDLHEMLEGLEPVDEAFFSLRWRRFVERSELQTELAPRACDMYCGTWRKPRAG